ncbi:MAG: hypothetical protein AAF578_05165 [Pseudomonadota bacterium]
MQGAHLSISEFGLSDFDGFPFHSRSRMIIAVLLSTVVVCLMVVAANGYFQRLGAKSPEAPIPALSLRLLPEINPQASDAAISPAAEPSNSELGNPSRSASPSEVETASSAASPGQPVPKQQSVDFYSLLQDVARETAATTESQSIGESSVFDPRLVGQLVRVRAQDQGVQTETNQPYINTSGETVVPISDTCHLEINAPVLSGLVDFDRFVPPRMVCRKETGIELEIRR